MNRCEKDILISLYDNPYFNQRMLAQASGYSLGLVNQCLKTLTQEGYINLDKGLTPKARKLFEDTKPQNAVILAAGYGMRMIPINTEIPKGLLEVHGEPLIERIIKQLHETDVKKIYIVVGFMKECYEYLIDEYGVELIVNSEYTMKNNLYSIKKASKFLGNTYVVPCDIWCMDNPFHKNELYSWYMVTDKMDRESTIRVNRKMELVAAPEESEGNVMVGISYLIKKDAEIIRNRIEQMCENSKYDNAFWEEALCDSGKMIVRAKVLHASRVVEINTYEQLRELDSSSSHLNSQAIELAATVLNVKETDIMKITMLKKGMTNRSFLFSCKGKKYIMRIPGEGTEQLINRAKEAKVYSVIKDKNICDHIIYMNYQNGYKITEYMDNARVCDAYSDSDIEKCMSKLRSLHELSLEVGHEFDIFKQIEFYESLWQEGKSVYRDYRDTKEKVFSLKEYIDQQPKKKVLTHIDAVPDNFLFYNEKNGVEKVCLIDWEYAGMQDPHVDIAMFCIYALYNKEQVDKLINIYFRGECPKPVRIKIYCYIAACGLLWSNWCEYKRCLGVEFGEYSLRQYRYAKEYYKIVQKELLRIEKNV